MATLDTPMTDKTNERRATALTKFTCRAQNLDMETTRVMAQAIAASDEAAHLGYYDTRTHVAVPAKPTWQMVVAGRDCDCWPLPDIYGDIDNPQKDEAASQIYRAMLAAHEGGEDE